ncbi:HAMP domain-containing protein [Oceanispirochaeta crateris]|nr:HAMP domain-containing protein [Oceanispirochaeta crateris]
MSLLKKIHLNNMNIRIILILIIALGIILRLISSVLIMSRSVNDYKLSKYIYLMNDVSDDLFTAVTNYGFERGRVNVLLNDAGHSEGMEFNKTFVIERRRDGDAALLSALSKLSAETETELNLSRDRIEQIRAEIAILRDLSSQEFTLPMESRNPQLSEIWFAKMTEYIESIESLLILVSQDISNSDGLISRYSSLKHKAMALRNIAGPEISILTATMVSGKPLKDKFSAKISKHIIINDEIFKDLNFLSGPLKGSPVYSSLMELRESYYDEYVKHRDLLYPHAIAGGPYPYTSQEYLGYGERFINSIGSFMETLVRQDREYTILRLEESRKAIFNHVVFLSASLLLFLFVLFLLINRILNPLVRLTDNIVLLGKGNTDVTIPQLTSKNEIGNMARGMAVFRDTLITLDNKMIELEKVSNERAQLIADLKKTLNEVKSLRAIIPICSYCKNIRNDQGYYEEIESYFSKNSDADFSHTICPDCMEKHFPGMSAGTKKDL